MKKIILSIILLSLSNLLYSQVGIATQNPLGVFHLDANKHLSDAGIFIIPTVFGSSFGDYIKKHTNGSKKVFHFFCNSNSRCRHNCMVNSKTI